MIQKYRVTIIIILCLILTGLCIYGGVNSPWLTLDVCLKDPEQYNGALVTHITEPRVGKITSDGFYLKSKGHPDIFVFSDTTGLISGEYLGITAIFHKEGHLEVQTLFIAENRRYKILLSIIPVILIAGLFFSHFHWNWKRMQFEEKSHA